MAPRKFRTAAVRPETHDSDSDEAPEVVTKQSAEQQAQQQRQKEQEARAQAKDAAKRKRKSKQDVQEEVLELSEEVLAAVAAREQEEQVAEQEAAKEQRREDKRRAKKQAKLLQKKTHTRQFGNIQVQTLEALEKTHSRELTDDTKQFLQRRTAPKRERMDVLKGHPAFFTKKQKQRA